jgi:hypothetical protein
VPDRSLLRPGPDGVYLPTAAVVVEIVSPDDDTWKKLLIVDPQERKVQWLALGPDGDYHELERSALIELGAAELAERIIWPVGYG